jgi:hypothetical protein
MASTENSLYMLPLKVSRVIQGDGAAAWVDCFVAARDLPSATSVAVCRLNGEKYLIIDFASAQVEQVDPKAWSTYITSRYPTAFDQFPSKAEVARIVTTGGVFLGPFSNWEKEA